MPAASRAWELLARRHPHRHRRARQRSDLLRRRLRPQHRALAERLPHAPRARRRFGRPRSQRERDRHHHERHQRGAAKRRLGARPGERDDAHHRPARLVAGWTASLLDDAEEATGLSKTGDGTLLTVHWLVDPTGSSLDDGAYPSRVSFERRDGRRRSGLRQQQPAARGDARDPDRRRGGGEPALDPRQRG